MDGESGAKGTDSTDTDSSDICSMTHAGDLDGESGENGTDKGADIPVTFPHDSYLWIR